MTNFDLLNPPVPRSPSNTLQWENLPGSASAIAIAQLTKTHSGPILIITENTQKAIQLNYELRFFADRQVSHFPELETLPYDQFSPHADIISERLETLNRLSTNNCPVLMTSIATLMQRTAPVDYVTQHSFMLQTKQIIHREAFRKRLEQSGYQCVSEVLAHGEFAVRGSIMDLFPMGSDIPYRIDLFDNEIDSIRIFDPETQRSTEKIDNISLLPTHEMPLTDKAIQTFKQKWSKQFDSDPYHCPLYEATLKGQYAAGIEYYLPFFFETTHSLFDYLQPNTLIIYDNNCHQAAENFWREVLARFNELQHDITRPILPPGELYLSTESVFAYLKKLASIKFKTDTVNLPNLRADHQLKNPLSDLQHFLQNQHARVLFCVETLGRRELILNLLRSIQIAPVFFEKWADFLKSDDRYGIAIAPIDRGLLANEPNIIILTENELLGQRVAQRRLRKDKKPQTEQTIRNLAELKIDDPVVHLNHGVGRFRGLQTLNVANRTDEYLLIEYADNDKLFVPVTSLDLISRYSSSNIEHAPLHKLGNKKWEKAKEKAAKRIRDVAAELLDIYSRRIAKKGLAYHIPESAYLAFAEKFPFEETPDQANAIEATLQDMQSSKSMDRLICGDVGFGKTEVAIRATFVAVQNNKQVAFLVPTTLLAQQHYETFLDRFANLPVHIEMLSRFRSTKEQKVIIEKLKAGKIDIIIGTHRLLQTDMEFKSLGLLIIDEEHRFGVRHKERLKSLRAEVDILTLTATPIPRTLNMAFSGIRDLSLIATPPKRRLSIKTFIQTHQDNTIRDALLRELMRGGQVYVVHNRVESILQSAERIAELVPEANIQIAHGQMSEHELEKIMSDFYHHRFNVLVCTTIIESGIDIPSANTIIIERADRFGLAQLHQLRGRVGRSHHQAYAYLLIPDKKSLTRDAEKRLDAIESLEDLGIGFTLATHDMEIRGTGELLGEEQSGHVQEIGFDLYMEMLERTVQQLKAGKTIDIDQALKPSVEIDLEICTLIPETYLPDVHSRLILYKRIANATDQQRLDDLRVEMIDRFGLLPEPTINLFEIASLKLLAEKIGIQSIKLNDEIGVITFTDTPTINPDRLIQLVQTHSKQYQFAGPKRLKFTLLPDEFEQRSVAERVKVVVNLLGEK